MLASGGKTRFNLSIMNNPEAGRHINRLFDHDILKDGLWLPAQEELRELQLTEGLPVDDETVELLADYQMNMLRELREGDKVCAIGNGQYYLQPLEDETGDADCETFFNMQDARIEGRHAGFLATTWPRYDGFFQSPAAIEPEATLCIELEEATVYDGQGAVQAYYPQRRTFVPINSTQLHIFRSMQDWLGTVDAQPR